MPDIYVDYKIQWHQKTVNAINVAVTVYAGVYGEVTIPATTMNGSPTTATVLKRSRVVKRFVRQLPVTTTRAQVIRFLNQRLAEFAAAEGALVITEQAQV